MLWSLEITGAEAKRMAEDGPHAVVRADAATLFLGAGGGWAGNSPYCAFTSGNNNYAVSAAAKCRHVCLGGGQSSGFIAQHHVVAVDFTAISWIAFVHRRSYDRLLSRLPAVFQKETP